MAVNIDDVKFGAPQYYSELSKCYSDNEILSIIETGKFPEKPYIVSVNDSIPTTASSPEGVHIEALPNGPGEPKWPNNMIVPVGEKTFSPDNIGSDGTYSRVETDISIPIRDGLDLSVKRFYNSNSQKSSSTKWDFIGKTLKYITDYTIKLNNQNYRNSLWLLEETFKNKICNIGGGWSTNLQGVLTRQWHAFVDSSLNLWWTSGGILCWGYESISVDTPAGSYMFYRGGNYKNHYGNSGMFFSVDYLNNSFTNDIKGSNAKLIYDPQTSEYTLILENGQKYCFHSRSYKYEVKEKNGYYNGSCGDYAVLWHIYERYLLDNIKNINGDSIIYTYEKTPSEYQDNLNSLRNNNYSLSNYIYEEFINANELIWPMRLSKIADNYGREIAISYREPFPMYSSYSDIIAEDNPRTNQIAQLSYKGVNGNTQYVQYSYNNDDQLQSVTYPNNKTIYYSYGYNSNDWLAQFFDRLYRVAPVLKSVTTPENMNITLQYDYFCPGISLMPYYESINCPEITADIRTEQTKFQMRHNKYTIANINYNNGGLDETYQYTFSPSAPEVFSNAEKAITRKNYWGIKYNSILGDESCSFQHIIIQTPQGNIEKYFHEGLPSKNINQLGWTTTMTWDYDKHRLLKQEENKAGMSRTIENSVFDEFNNPKEIKEYINDPYEHSSPIPDQQSNVKRIEYLHEVDNEVKNKNILNIIKKFEYIFNSYTKTTEGPYIGPPGTIGFTEYTTTVINSKIENRNFSNGNPYPYSIDLSYTGLQNGPIRTYYTYDPNGFLTNQTLPEGQVINYTYQTGTPYLQRTGYTDVNLNTVKTYDSNTGLLLSDSDFNMTKMMSYYNDGRLKDITYPDNTKETAVYNDMNRKIIFTDRIGQDTAYYYDGFGRTIKIDLGGAPYQSDEYKYNAGGKIIGHYIRRGAKTRADAYSWDNLNRLTAAYLADGNNVRIDYADAQGKKSVTDANGHITDYYSDFKDRLRRVAKKFNGTYVEADYSYDLLDNLTAFTDFNGLTSSYGYNMFGQLTSYSSPFQETASYAYDKNGNLIREYRTAQKYLDYSGYDSLGNKLLMIAPSLNYSYVYNNAGANARGKLYKVNLQNGYAAQFGYNQDGLLTSLQYTYPGNYIYQLFYTYNASGQLLSITDPRGITGYSYDNQKRLTQIKRNNTIIVNYNYDEASDDFVGISSYTMNGGKINVNFVYPGSNSDRIQSVIAQVNNTSLFNSNFLYDNVGNRTRTNFSDTHYSQPLITDYSYDSLYQLTGARYNTNINFDYRYNAVGNREYYRHPLSEVNYAYQKNSNNKSVQLSNYWFDTVTANLTYDSLGNMTGRNFWTKNLDGTVKQIKNQTLNYDILNNLTRIISSGNGSFTDNSYAYDHTGRRIASYKNGLLEKYYIWGQGNDIIAETDNQGNIMKTFIYSLSGERLAEESNYSDVPKLKYFVNDMLGTPVKILDDNAAIVSEYNYDPYGHVRFQQSLADYKNTPAILPFLLQPTINQTEALSVTGTTNFQAENQIVLSGNIVISNGGSFLAKAGQEIRLGPGFQAAAGSSFTAKVVSEDKDTNHYTFTGKEYDDNIGFYYFGARWYDPLGGRFLSIDPKRPNIENPQELNPYQYCYNNPLIAIDPDGRRTYLSNGINNDNGSTIAPREVRDFAWCINKILGRDEVVTVPGIYNSGNTAKDVFAVLQEMSGKEVYSDKTTEFIKKDLEKRPLAKNEKLNFVGYSGGSPVLQNVAKNLNNIIKIDNFITLGSPLDENSKTNINKTTHIISKNDFFYPILAKDRKIDNVIEYNNLNHAGFNSYLDSIWIINDIINIIQ